MEKSRTSSAKRLSPCKGGDDDKTIGYHGAVNESGPRWVRCEGEHMRLSVLLLLPFFALGCSDDGGGPDDRTELGPDQRIDGAGAGDETVNSSAPRMCRSQNGNLYVVWYDSREGGNDIWFQASLNGGTSWLSRPTQVNPGTGAATNPDIACIGNTVFVTWEDTSDGDLDAKSIYFSRSDSAGTSWLEEPLRLDADPEGKFMSVTPRIASVKDEVHVVWADVVNGSYDIYAASSTSRGATFGPPIRVDSDPPGAAFSADPKVVADGDGQVVVVWEDSRNSLNDIYAAASTDSGETFSADVRLDGGDEPGSSESFAPQIALSEGHAYVVWHDLRNGENRDVLMNWSEDGGVTWKESAIAIETDSPESPNVPGDKDSRFPDVAMTGQVAHVVWQDNRNSGYDVFYRSFEAGTPRVLDTERGDGEPAAADGELRLDISDLPGFGNSINATVAAVEERVVVVWEDRRNDGYNPADPNTDLAPRGFNEVQYTFSENGGITWAPDDYQIDSYCQGGKYATDIQMAIAGDEVVAIWRDGRRGNDDIFFGSQELGESGQFLSDDDCSSTSDDPE